MTSSSLSSNPETFPSLASLRVAHSELVKQYRQTGLTPELLTEVETFLLRGPATGAVLDTEDDRWAAQSLLDYWTSILHRKGQEPPDATLVEFDPSLAPELPDSLCPYLGLEAFHEKNYNLFYGRQRLLNKLLKHLQNQHFLAVIGSSGSGKSSIVLGGLIPSLKAGRLPESETWHYYSPMVPGSHPLNNLARVLCPEEQNLNTWIDQQIEKFQADPKHLLKLLNKGSCQPGVLVIDQFEEIFTLCVNDQTRQAFIDNLLTVIQSSKNRHLVIATMRTDFESRVALYPNLQQAFERGQVRVTAMDAKELREAIEKPAESIGLKFEEGLVEKLLEDVLGEPAALPLLQFTLLKLWENRERNRVTWETYKRLGGGRSALSRSADELYNQLIPEDQVALKRILLKMVKPTEGLEVTSSRIPHQSLYQQGEARDRIDRVLDRLIQARLVRLTEGEQSADTQVEVAHEALVRNWPRLVEWLEDERINLRKRWRLKSAAEQWHERHYDPSVLWRGALLEDAQSYQDLSQLEQEFVRFSLEVEREQKETEILAAKKLLEAEREQREAEQKLYLARQRFYVRQRVLSILVISGLSAFAIFAIDQKYKAEKSLLEVQLLQKADEVNTLITTSPEEGLILAIQITGQSNTKLKRVPVPIQQSLQNAVGTVIPSIQGSSGSINDVAFSPDGRLIATAGADGTVKLLSTDGTLVKTLEGHEAQVTSVTFSPDGQLIATTSADQTVKLWNLQGQLMATLAGHQAQVTSVAFSPDGKLIATTSADQTVKLWKPDGTLVTILKGHTDQVTSVAFSPDGKLIATASADQTVKLWKPDGTLVKTLAGHQAQVTSVAFSPDGKLIATASADKTVKLWNLRGQLMATLAGHDAQVTSVAFSPDGKLIATASADGTVRLWDINGNQVGQPIDSPQGSFTSVSFSPNGQTIATTGRDGVTRIWNLQGKLLNQLSDQNWEQLLKLACNKMRDRPILADPKTDTAREAKKTCQKEPWKNK
jgi:Tol biopolymer transport system component